MPFITTDADIISLLRRSRTIAVVGCSANPARDSNSVAQYLLRQGYTVIPVNPALTEVLGLKAYPDLESIGEPVDIVDVFRRPEFVPPIVDSAIRSGARALWLQLDTVDEVASERAASAGLDVVADRCIMADHRRLLA
ncbi:MAG TPA: CoA-binding protein [Bacteroidota bacterium]|nr:CoA-binding protein [Bacteroidota bacterium]